MKYILVATTIFAGDFFLKKHIEEQRDFKEETKLFSGKVTVRKCHNRGMALNYLEKCPKLVKNISGIIFLMIGILWYLCFKKKKNLGIMLAFSLIVGGGASNFFDRVTKGYVIDYVSFQTPWKKLNHVVFNISDLCIFLGSLLLVLFGRD
ncbi:MAG: signal peptidase II [Lachnospiraceae bacterium]